MRINEDIVKGKWLEVKGEIQKTWGKLTSDEIEATKGDVKSLAGIIQQRYGDASENIHEQYTLLLSKIVDTKDSLVDTIKGATKP